MTETTTTAKKTKAHPLDIPWFLDAKNPINIARQKANAHQPELKDGFVTRRTTAPVKDVVAEQTAPVTPTVKPVATVINPTPVIAPKPKKAKLSGSEIIRVLVKEFGHKPGSKAEIKSAGLRDGMTVAEYMSDNLGIAGKWHTSHISHCVGKAFIKLEN